MTDPNADKDKESPSNAGEKAPVERFGLRDAGSRVTGAGSERRLHLVALDYWHDLRQKKAMPDFRQLTPDGMAPFRSVSLLLDFSARTETDQGSTSAFIRFAGDTVSAILAEQPVAAGMDTAELAVTEFGRKLLEHLNVPSSRLNPSEFDYQDAMIAGRGILMPLSLGDKMGSFIWVVATFDFVTFDEEIEPDRDGEYIPPPPIPKVSDPVALDEVTDVFSYRLKRARHLADETPNLGLGAREALYQTLQAAYALFEAGEADMVAWQSLLESSGLKLQQRAPYTPALKLVFGKDYDKTRLTEYAAALAHARRNDVGSDDFIDWIEGQPGGIKGCVDRERNLKKGGRAKTPLKRQAAKISPALSRQPAVGSLDLPAEVSAQDAPLMMAYLRPNNDGTADIIGFAPATAQDQRRAVTILKKTSGAANRPIDPPDTISPESIPPKSISPESE